MQSERKSESGSNWRYSQVVFVTMVDGWYGEKEVCGSRYLCVMLRCVGWAGEKWRG
jgi:hypothetical protein